MIYSFTAIIFFVLSICVWREKSIKSSSLLFIIAIVWLILHDGLRWEVGTDWGGYFDAFYDDANSHMGFTYRCLNRLFRVFSDSYTVFLITYAIFFYVVISNFINKYSPHPLMAICIYYCTMLKLMGCNRQLLALALCVISLHFIFERKKIHFFILILAASTIHITALTFLPAYYMYHLAYNKRNAWIVLTIAFIVGFFKLVNMIPFVEYLSLLDSFVENTSTARYASYSSDFTISNIGAFKRLAIAYMALNVKNRINSEVYGYFLLLYLFGICIYLVFNGTCLQILVGRGALYYNVFECIVITSMLLYYPIGFFGKKILWFIIFLIYFYSMWKDINYYIIATGEDCFNPYKCVLF